MTRPVVLPKKLASKKLINILLAQGVSLKVVR